MNLFGFASFSCGLRQMRCIIWLFHRRLGKMIKYLQAKQRTRLECKDYVIGIEITTLLKTAEDNAILEFSESSRTELRM